MKLLFDYLQAWFYSKAPEKQKGEEMEEELIADSDLAHMYRVYHKNGTHTEWVFPNGDTVLMAERPWKDNEQYESCIPEGIYPLQKRSSGVVQRTSKGKYPEGWEIAEVPNRVYIMVHIGNWPLVDSDGCPLTGKTHAWDGDKPVVWNSAKAFERFMYLMDKHKPTHVSIEEKASEA